MGGSAVPAGVIADAVAAARLWLRLEAGTEDDAVLGGLAATAIGMAEAFCGQALVLRGFEDVLTASAAWQRLEATPVMAIAGVTGLPIAAAPFVLAVDDYAIDLDVEGGGWVRVTAAQPPARLGVSYTAGAFANWDVLPAPVAQGITMLVAHLFETRGGEAAAPAAVAALWRPFRRLRLDREVRA